MNKITHILSNKETPINDQMLIDYLEGKLTSEQNRLVEEWLNTSPLASEAIEGLMHIQDKMQLQFVVKELNYSLQKELRKKHKRNRMAYSKMTYWFAIGLIIVLLICIVTYFAINILRHK
jgi:hypothetical protein